jgi:hypothetical protein
MYSGEGKIKILILILILMITRYVLLIISEKIFFAECAK